jgi:diaminopimelate decarboxylase
MRKQNTIQASLTERLKLFPDSTRILADALTIAEIPLSQLAEEYGTPLYLYDRLTMDASVAQYREALKSYEGKADITYAGKAFLCRAIAEWAQSQELWLDCTGETETSVACKAGVKREHILMHGVNKSPSDLMSGLEYAGTIVVDNLAEIKRLKKLIDQQKVKKDQLPHVWLRLLPGLAVHTHHKHTQTGQHDSKFGMTPTELLQAAEFCRANNLSVNGLHFHQGSNFRDPSPLVEAITLGLDLAAELRLEREWHFSPGGGWAVAYHEDELPHPSIEAYVHMISENVMQGCRQTGIPLPHLHIEPGRSLIARAGVAMYRIGAVKKRGERTWLLADGGMTDNPRHAMYGSKYSALPVERTGRELTIRTDVAGPFCESGDILIEDLPMPALEEEELIALPVSGAYQLSMSSNYNGARRPAVIWLDEGKSRLIQRRETVEDLGERDLSLKV